MSMIEGVESQLSEVANTPATDTLIEALSSLSLAWETLYDAISQDTKSTDASKAIDALRTAKECTQEAIGYVLGGGITIREYAHRVGLELAPPIQRPIQNTSFDAESFLPEKTILAKLLSRSVSESTPDSHIPEAAAERAKAILTDLRNGVKREDIDGHISSGFEKLVFRLPDGHILKLPYLGGGSFASSKEEALTSNRKYVDALKHAQNREGFEQFVGWFDEPTGAIICKEVPGRTTVDMTPVEVEFIPQRHFDQLMQTIKAAAELRINIDIHPTNIMYDPQIGFTFIDFGSYEDQEVMRPEDVALLIGSNESLLHDRVIDVDDYMTLQIVGRKFYYALEEAFGAQTAGLLRQRWQEEGIRIATKSW